MGLLAIARTDRYSRVVFMYDPPSRTVPQWDIFCERVEQKRVA